VGRDLPRQVWQVKFRKGYIAFQRASGYNVMVIDPDVEPTCAPREPASLQEGTGLPGQPVPGLRVVRLGWSVSGAAKTERRPFFRS
jgi:hypothetical protein